MKKTVIAIGLAVVVVLGIGYVYAGPGFGSGMGPGKWAGGPKALNLTEEQQAKIKDLRQQHSTEIAPLREQMFSLMKELRTLWSDPKSNAGAIQAKTKEMSALRDQMQEKMVAFRLEEASLLTPEVGS